MDNTQEKSQEGLKITGDWNKHSSVLKEKYPSLTSEDLKFEPGKEQELIARVSTRLNKKQEEVVNIIKKNTEVK